ncbi:Methyltransferase-like protein 9 [Balamuthia mandrillaris]
MKSWSKVAVQRLYLQSNAASYPSKKAYLCSLDKLPPDLQERFVPLHCDEDGRRFVEACQDRMSSLDWRDSFLVTGLLNLFCSVTDTNALLGRGQMHVLSTQQLAQLLDLPIAFDTLLLDDEEGAPSSWPSSSLSPATSASSSSSSQHHSRAMRLLEVGAGDGNVTRKFVPLLGGPHNIVCTEVSKGMANRLRDSGFACVECSDLSPSVIRTAFSLLNNHSTSPPLGLDNATTETEHATPCDSPTQTGYDGPFFDVVSCLNVLDRCDKPKTLLRQMKDALRPGSGRLLLAIVLPFHPFVEDGPSWSQKQPSEQLLPSNLCNLRCCFDWEATVEGLVKDVFAPMGLKLEKWARVPYLCCGMDGKRGLPYLSLDDVIFVLSRGEEEEEEKDEEGRKGWNEMK